jgi:hypothetical protein
MLSDRFRPVAICALYAVLAIIFCWTLFGQPLGLGANDWISTSSITAPSSKTSSSTDRPRLESVISLSTFRPPLSDPLHGSAADITS